MPIRMGGMEQGLEASPGPGIPALHTDTSKRPKQLWKFVLLLLLPVLLTCTSVTCPTWASPANSSSTAAPWNQTAEPYQTPHLWQAISGTQPNDTKLNHPLASRQQHSQAHQQQTRKPMALRKSHAGLYAPKSPSALTTHSFTSLTAEKRQELRALVVAAERVLISPDIVHGTPDQRENYFLDQVDAVLNADGQHNNITGLSSTADLDRLTVVFRVSRRTETQQGHTNDQVAALSYRMMSDTTPRDSLAMFGRSTKHGVPDEYLKPQQPVTDRHTTHPDFAGLTAKLRNIPLVDALMIKENATTVGGLLASMYGMRQESSDDAPRIVQGAVRVTINPPSFPKDSEESYLATVKLVYGQPTPDVSITQEFMRMMRVAATATAARDSIPQPAPGNAEAQQQYEAAKQRAEQMAAEGAAAVSSAINQPGLHALSKEDLAVVEIKGLSVAKGQSKEGTKYFVHTFSSAAAAALAGVPLCVCDGSKVVRVEPLKIPNPAEMKYAMLYRAPSAALLSSDAMLLAVRDTLVAGCRDAATELVQQLQKLSAEEKAKFIAAVPTGLGKTGRIPMQTADADDMRLIICSIMGTPIALLDPAVLERLMQRGNLFAVRYADAQSQMLGAAMAMLPQRGFPGQQRIKVAVSNLSNVGGSGVFWAPDPIQPDPTLAVTPAILEAKGSNPSAYQVVQQLMAALAADMRMADLTDPLIKAGVKAARHTLMCEPVEKQQLIVSAAAVARSPQQRLENILGDDSDDDDGQMLEALKQSHLAARKAIDEAGKRGGKRGLEGGPAGREDEIDRMDMDGC